MFAPRIKGLPRACAARWLLSGLVGVCVSLAPALTFAADNCTVSAVTHAFGAYDTINPLAGTSSITVNCSHTGGGNHTFNYTLKLSTAAHTTVWGDGTSGTSTVSGSFSVGGNSSGFQIQTVYGLIGGPQNVTPGAYSTASPITVTLSGAPSNAPTTTFNTTASVAAQCNVSAANLGFGAINPLSSQVDATTTLTVNCTKNSPYIVGLDAGVTTGATIAQRLMANGANTMQYNLYTNSARSSIWGNSSGSWVSGTGAGLAIAQTLTVYGRVANGQTNLAVGNYQENTITVTVTY